LGILADFLAAKIPNHLNLDIENSEFSEIMDYKLFMN